MALYTVSSEFLEQMRLYFDLYGWPFLPVPTGIIEAVARAITVSKQPHGARKAHRRKLKRARR